MRLRTDLVTLTVFCMNIGALYAVVFNMLMYECSTSVIHRYKMHWAQYGQRKKDTGSSQSVSIHGPMTSGKKHPARIFKRDQDVTSKVVKMRNEVCESRTLTWHRYTLSCILACHLEIRSLLEVFYNLTPTMSADARVIHLLTLKCGPPLDKEPSREEIKLAERMASILKDFEARQLEVDEDEQLEAVEEDEEDWDLQDELMNVERQASSGHMITFLGGTLASEERVASPSFGKPCVARGGSSSGWTPDEEKYLPCLDRRCVCPYFNGSIQNNECVLPNGKKLEKARRQEIRTLDDRTRDQFVKTLNCMKASGLYNRIGRVHKYFGVHRGPSFTLWHREYLKRFELVIRHYLPDPNIGIPYWDSTLDAELPEPTDSMVFTDIFFGETNKYGLVVTGPYANWTTMEGACCISRRIGSDPYGRLLNNTVVSWIVNNPDINMVLGNIEPLRTCPVEWPLDAKMLEMSHNYVHWYIGGDMQRSNWSTNDVIFLYHHSMVDLIYEHWRQRMQSRTERERDYPPSDERCFPPKHNIDSIMPMLHPLTNRDALSNDYTDEMYEFAPRPTCSRAKPSCGSKYLFCYMPKGRHARCMAKIRPGGDCTGFGGTEICFDGECIDGICEKSIVHH